MVTTQWDLTIEPVPEETDHTRAHNDNNATAVRGWPLKHKIALSVVLVVALAATIVAGVDWDLRSQLYQVRRDGLRNTVELADSMIAGFAKRADQGYMSKSEAKRRALDALAEMRFGKTHNNYVFVSDTDDRIVWHPHHQPGTPMHDYVDDNGVPVYRELGDMASKNGHGFVYYLSQRDKTSPQLPKMTYVERFKPWGWNIAAGVYIDDIRAAFIHQLIKYGLILGGFALLVALVLILLARNIYRALGGETYEAPPSA